MHCQWSLAALCCLAIPLPFLRLLWTWTNAPLRAIHTDVPQTASGRNAQRHGQDDFADNTYYLLANLEGIRAMAARHQIRRLDALRHFACFRTEDHSLASGHLEY